MMSNKFKSEWAEYLQPKSSAFFCKLLTTIVLYCFIWYFQCSYLHFQNEFCNYLWHIVVSRFCLWNRATSHLLVSHRIRATLLLSQDIKFAILYISDITWLIIGSNSGMLSEPCHSIPVKQRSSWALWNRLNRHHDLFHRWLAGSIAPYGSPFAFAPLLTFVPGAFATGLVSPIALAVKPAASTFAPKLEGTMFAIASRLVTYLCVCRGHLQQYMFQRLLSVRPAWSIAPYYSTTFAFALCLMGRIYAIASHVTIVVHRPRFSCRGLQNAR